MSMLEAVLASDEAARPLVNVRASIVPLAGTPRISYAVIPRVRLPAANPPELNAWVADDAGAFSRTSTQRCCALAIAPSPCTIVHPDGRVRVAASGGPWLPTNATHREPACAE